MLSEEALRTVGILSYCVMFEKTPACAESVDRILECIIYDPLSRVTPEQQLTYIEEALLSDADLSNIGPECPHSDQTLRDYLSAVAEAIRDKHVSIPTIDVEGELSSSVRADIEPLLSTVANDPNLNQALFRFEHEILATWRFIKTHIDTKQTIRYLLKTNYPLAELVGNRFSEPEFRQFLVDAARKIEDHMKTIDTNN